MCAEIKHKLEPMENAGNHHFQDPKSPLAACGDGMLWSHFCFQDPQNYSIDKHTYIRKERDSSIASVGKGA